MDNKSSVCPIEVIQKVIGGKWKIMILWALNDGTKRFNELQRLFPNITQTMLTKQLRELENDKFVYREIYKEIPPRVEYSLTDTGRDFMPIIHNMYDWTKNNLL
jgi:DNA-binding HxlR family transcriptional regulator